MPSPTSRSLAECRKRGWKAGIVERWIPQAMKRIDLFGCLDIVAIGRIDGQERIIGIQTTTVTNQAARVTKIKMDCPDIGAWFAAGGRVYVWGWAKHGPRGKRKLWTLTETEVTETYWPKGGAQA